MLLLGGEGPRLIGGSAGTSRHPDGHLPPATITPAMPKLTINGRDLDYKPGQTILQVANDAGITIPQYCYHDGLSIVASCRTSIFRA